MKFALTILGINSATPAHGRFPTSQILQIDNHFFLIDCGEGSQIRMDQYNISRQKINHIFISHLHGDHIFGLPGLLFSFDLNKRRRALDIYAPPGLHEMVSALLHPGGQLSYPINFHELDTQAPALIFENDTIEIQSIPLLHRIPTVGFIFREKARQRNIRPEKIKEYSLSIPQIKAAKAGDDILLNDGSAISNEELTIAPPSPRSYAFITDTRFDEQIVPFISEVDLLYHDTTFCNDLAERAFHTMHSTAQQAAIIAKKAGAGKLITGHYSSRYQDLQVFLEEAGEVFKATELGLEGQVYEVPFRND